MPLRASERERGGRHGRRRPRRGGLRDGRGRDPHRPELVEARVRVVSRRPRLIGAAASGASAASARCAERALAVAAQLEPVRDPARVPDQNGRVVQQGSPLDDAAVAVREQHERRCTADEVAARAADVDLAPRACPSPRASGCRASRRRGTATAPRRRRRRARPCRRGSSRESGRSSARRATTEPAPGSRPRRAPPRASSAARARSARRRGRARRSARARCARRSSARAGRAPSCAPAAPRRRRRPAPRRSPIAVRSAPHGRAAGSRRTRARSRAAGAVRALLALVLAELEPRCEVGRLAATRPRRPRARAARPGARAGAHRSDLRPQALGRARDPRLDGPRPAREHGGDLTLGKLEQVAQREHGAVALVEPRERREQLVRAARPRAARSPETEPRPRRPSARAPRARSTPRAGRRHGAGCAPRWRRSPAARGGTARPWRKRGSARHALRNASCAASSASAAEAAIRQAVLKATC